MPEKTNGNETSLARSFLLALAVLSALLMHTSLYNLGDTGVPLFYAVFPVAAFIFTLPHTGAVKVPRHVVALFVAMSAIVLFVTALHPFFNIGDPEKEVKQIVSRVLYAAFFVASAVIVRNGGGSERAFRWLKTGLKLALIYGFYQFAAGFLHLPLFLDFLRNSKSFFMSENYEGGWINMFRAMSIWSEPSASALPVGIFLFILFFRTHDRGERIRWFILITIFSLITFSRVTWATWGISVVVYALTRAKGRLGTLFDFAYRHRYAVAFLMVLVLMQWAVIVPEDAEGSATTRSQTVLMGQKLFVEHPLLGSGLNSFAKLSESVATAYSEEELVVVHNLFVSYAQQLGVLGIVLSVLPIFYVLWMEHIPGAQRLFLAAIFIVIGSLGGDFFYASFAWFVLGVLAVEESQAAQKQLARRVLPVEGTPQPA